MFTVNDDGTIHVTRGDAISFGVRMKDKDGTAKNFIAGETVRIKVYGKRDASNVVLQKDFYVTTDTDSVQIYLSSEETKFEGIINKPKDYWYEVELNPNADTQTIIGYNEDGPAVFRLYPEGKDIVGSNSGDSSTGSETYVEIVVGHVFAPEVIKGKSAYEVALENGFDGTEEEWLASLAEEANRIAMKYADEAKTFADDIKEDARQTDVWAQSARGWSSSANVHKNEAKSYAESAEASAQRAEAVAQAIGALTIYNGEYEVIE